MPKECDLSRDALEVSVEEMEQESVARFDQVPFYLDQFLDTKLPGHSRSQANLIGAFSSSPGMTARIVRPHNFFTAFMLLQPKARAALHNHKTAEVFMPIQGTLRLFWGADGSRSLDLKPLDLISVPPGIFRGFENPGDEDLLLLGILEGPEPGSVVWGPGVEVQALERGYEIGSDGLLHRLDGNNEPPRLHHMHLEEPVRTARDPEQIA